MKESDVDEDDEIDIMTAEKDTTFSDSDMSEDEVLYLPVDISPDVPEEQDKCIGMGDSNHSGSPLSEDAEQNGQVAKYASSPIDGNYTPLKIIYYNTFWLAYRYHAYNYLNQ